MSSLLSINGVDVTDAVIHLPRVGVWHTDLNINKNKELMSGRATIKFGTQQFTGFFTQVGLDLSNRLRARVVGGNGAYSTLLKPKGYNGIQLKIPLQDAITDSGELGLSTTSDPNILNVFLETWSRMQVTGGSVIANLIRAVENLQSAQPAWRILSDGTLWVGFESWPTISLPQATLIDSEPEKGRVKIASSDPVVLPGQTFSYTPAGQSIVNQRVSYVRHVITPAWCETLIFYENEADNVF